MNKVMTLLLLGIVLASFVLSPFDDVVSAIKQGNVNTLSKYLDNMVEITLADKSNSYSKAQAEVILKQFFETHPVKSFEIVHKGGEDSKFGIGNLVTGNGAYRITFFLRQKGNNYVLQELRFENSN